MCFQRPGLQSTHTHTHILYTSVRQSLKLLIDLSVRGTQLLLLGEGLTKFLSIIIWSKTWQNVRSFQSSPLDGSASCHLSPFSAPTNLYPKATSVKAERKEKKNLHVLVCCVPAQGQRKEKKSWAKYKKEKRSQQSYKKFWPGLVLCLCRERRSLEARVVVV